MLRHGGLFSDLKVTSDLIVVKDRSVSFPEGLRLLLTVETYLRAKGVGHEKPRSG